MTYIIKAQDLNCFRSGNIIFQGLNFDIKPGSNLEIIGSNGSGKTSFLRLILGFIPEYEGLIHWSGNQEGLRVLHQKKSCFYQGHETGIKPLLSVYENLKYSSSGMHSSEEEIKEAVKRVGIDKYLYKPTSLLSAGQRKRVAIARWLLKDFDLYLIDEPFTALDDKGFQLIEEIINELNQKGSSFLITGHRVSALNSEKIVLDNLR